MTVTTRYGGGPRARLSAFLEPRGLSLVGSLGHGQEGEVYRTDRFTAVKVHRFRELARREIEVYERLRERGVAEVCGHAVPLLLDADATLGVLHLTLVRRPFVLDFSLTAFQKPSFVEEDPAVRPGGGLFTEEQVVQVREVRRALWEWAGGRMQN